MLYLKDADEIIAILAKYVEARMLWIDTEIADFLTRSPKLSLIQILDNLSDHTGQNVTILDILEQPEVVDIFVKKIMLNPAIEKVFHHANYDLKYLGKTKAKNVTCTLEMAKKFLTIFCHYLVCRLKLWQKHFVIFQKWTKASKLVTGDSDL
jgi:ribonuclease D